jgi:hypothetical protein
MVRERHKLALWSDLRLDPADLLARMDRKHTQRRIRKAEGMPISLHVNETPAREVLRLYDAFAATKGLRADSRLDSLAKRVQVCDISEARYDGTPVVYHIMLRDFPRCVRVSTSFHSLEANVDDATRSIVNRYLHWMEMLRYRDEGFSLYGWGSVALDPESPAYNISTFKRSFGGDEIAEWELVLAGRALRTVLGPVLRRVGHPEDPF